MKEKKFAYYVYLTTNLINNKKYVGSHRGVTNDNYYGSGKIIKNALKKYNKENFKKEILEKTESRKEAFLLEKKYIDKFNTLYPSGYNLSPTGGMGNWGGKHSEKMKARMRILNLGKKYSEETNKKKGLPGEKNPFYGKHHTKESREKQSESHKGNKSWVGKKHTEESKLKISRSLSENGLFKGEKNPMYGKAPWNKGLKLK